MLGDIQPPNCWPYTGSDCGGPAKCPHHRREEIKQPTTAVREHWVYQGACVALGYGGAVEGQRCYWFRRENIGQGGITLIIPITKYWNSR